MTLETCLKIGEDCGLTTWEECYDNIILHAINMFKYENIGIELLELQKDMFRHNPDKFCQIFNSTKEDLISKGWEVV